MNQQPDVSVIVAAYNGIPYIELMLDSLIRQTIGLDRMQVLVVDDGSTDETPAVLDRVAAAHPAFEVIHRANSGGPAGPRNGVLELVRGRYMFFLDEDDHISDDALEAMVRVADDNGTDVVLSRIKGVGGRATPRAMFARTLPRTDVHSSAAYWSLNPLKLFRTEMVRSLGLKFDEDAPWGEDQPFVATAYLKGDGISILADKDYLYWVYRDDRSNITTSKVTLADRMPVVDRMFDLVAENVPAGPLRDRLMRRHFRLELVDSACEGYRRETDPVPRAAAFKRFGEIVDAYYTDRVERALAPGDRVLMRLVAERRSDDFAEYLDALAQAAPPETVVEDGRVYLALPWFRDPAKGLPDDLFDIGHALKVGCRVEPLVVDAAGVHVGAVCRFGALTDRVTDVSLVARPRIGGDDVVLPVAHGISLDEELPSVLIEDVLTADRLLAGLPAGTHDLYIRLQAGAIARERRLVECAAPAPGRRVVHRFTQDGSAMTGVLRSGAKGALAVRALEGACAVVRALETAEGPRIEVSHLPVRAGSSPAPALRLARAGRSVGLPLVQDRCDGPVRVLSFDARRLAPGTHAMRLAVAGYAQDFPLVAMNGAHRLKRTTSRGPRISIDGGALTVVPVWRLALARVRRRLRRLFARVSPGTRAH